MKDLIGINWPLSAKQCIFIEIFHRSFKILKPKFYIKSDLDSVPNRAYSRNVSHFPL